VVDAGVSGALIYATGMSCAFEDYGMGILFGGLAFGFGYVAYHDSKKIRDYMDRQD
jgi:hypothetical protein